MLLESCVIESRSVLTTKLQPDLSILIVNWNAKGVLASCLTSIANNAAGLDMEVWVVDNASTDGSQEMLSAQFSWANLIPNSHNAGFAAANNQAIARSAGRYILLLNPDTEILSGALQSMIAYMEQQPAVGILGPRLLNSDGTHQRSCWRGYPDVTMALTDAFYLWRLSWLPLNSRSEYRSDELVAPIDVDHVLGAALMIRRETLDQIGPLDEGFFMYLEETDWCLRAKQAGWKVVYYPDATIIHHGQHSSRQQPAKNLPYYYRSFCRFYRKHKGASRPKIWTLKLTMALAALNRIGLWLTRVSRAQNDLERMQARRMVAGYRQVIRELPQF